MAERQSGGFLTFDITLLGGAQSNNATLNNAILDFDAVLQGRLNLSAISDGAPLVVDAVSWWCRCCCCSAAECSLPCGTYWMHPITVAPPPEPPCAPRPWHPAPRPWPLPPAPAHCLHPPQDTTSWASAAVARQINYDPPQDALVAMEALLPCSAAINGEQGDEQGRPGAAPRGLGAVPGGQVAAPGGHQAGPPAAASGCTLSDRQRATRSFH